VAQAKKLSSGKWFIQLKIAGKRVSKTGKTRREVETWATIKASELRRQPEGEHTLKQALDRYANEVSNSKRGVMWEIVRINAFKGPLHGLPINRLITNIMPADMSDWRDRRLKTVSKGTDCVTYLRLRVGIGMGRKEPA
jgi:hypothetical protein